MTSPDDPQLDVAKVIAAAGRILARKPHDYVKDPFSGAGNCWCGAHERARIHHILPPDDSFGSSDV